MAKFVDGPLLTKPVKKRRGFNSLIQILAISCTSSLLTASPITQGEAKALEQEIFEAKEALRRILLMSPDGEVRKEAKVAAEAIRRVSEKLSLLIGEQGENEDDPYDGGKNYPEVANVWIEPFSVPVGTKVVHLPVTLDKLSPNTVIAHIRVYDGKGGRADPDTRKAVIFRPGDPLTKTVSFQVRDMAPGNTVRAVQYEVPDGGNRKGSGIEITAETGAQNTPIENEGREPMKFKPYGNLTYHSNGENILFDDSGGPNIFSTALSHGRTQPGNGETGYYGTVAMNGYTRTPEGLLLSTRRLAQPIKIGSPAVEYPFLATMLSGHRTTQAQLQYGSVEWEVKMPNRPGSWPALWLLPTDGWPPEIDVYEGFGYNGSWRFNTSLSTNLHGGEKNERTFTRAAMRMTMETFGLEPSLDSAFHKFAVTIRPEWITMFIDGKETMQYANPFKGKTWYPLMNVAVKADPQSTYDEGSGAMTLKSIKVWRDM